MTVIREILRTEMGGYLIFVVAYLALWGGWKLWTIFKRRRRR